MPKLSYAAVNRLVLAAVAIGFLIVLGVGILVAVVLQRNITYSSWVAHTYEVQDALSEHRVLTERVEATRRGYLISREQSFLDRFHVNADLLPEALARIKRLTRDNAIQRANVVELEELQHSHLAALEASIEDARQGKARPASSFDLDPGVRDVRAIRALTTDMMAEEQRLLKIRDADRRRSATELTVAMIVGGVLLIIVASGSVLVIFNFTRDLNRSREELRRLNDGLEDEVRARTSDLQRANDEIQRFAYIVSHDLRSPLVNVMGFTSELEAAAKPLVAMLDEAESKAPALVTPAARDAVRQDLPEAIGFIRSSTQKMDRLINAILRLSREGRRILTPEVVDMDALFAGIAATLKHRSDELGATIEIVHPAPAIVSDRLALEQIFSNIVENALKYLAAGRPGHIVIRGEMRPGDRLVYEIQDNGRGVDPKDHERIFDLFRRSGAQDQPGEGIGLAHVRALAYRLGGTVSVDSRLDQGATFRVSLPARLLAEGGQA